MSTRWPTIAWMVASVGVALLAGCAAGPGGDGSQTTETLRPPAQPLYRHTFTTPGGREWDFVLGSGYYSDR